MSKGLNLKAIKLIYLHKDNAICNIMLSCLSRIFTRWCKTKKVSDEQILSMRIKRIDLK